MSHSSTVRACAAGLLAALSAACASTRVTRFDPATRPPQRTPASEIRFYGAERPKCPYEEIGRIIAEGGQFVSWSRVVRAARNAAHDLGGDAVIGVQEGARLSGATISTSGVGLEETTSLSGTVIRFRHLDCME